MSKESKPAEMASLELCNLASVHGLKKAREIMAERASVKDKEAKAAAKDAPVVLSASEKKIKIIKAIEKLGGEAPQGGSVAVYAQALTVAQENAKGKKDKKPSGDASDLM